MRFDTGSELPEDLREPWHRAQRLEIFSIAFLAFGSFLVFLVLGSSQAMKAAWIEDLLSLIPPIAFLIAARVRYRRPGGHFPFGRHRAVEVSYLVSAVALLTMGAYLLYDSVVKLARAEHPAIGLVEIFDGQIWLGWLMLGVVVVTGVPPVILGRLKRPLAEQLHDKVLTADAKMNRADWMTASAAGLGVAGIGLGWWWADAAAAIVIAFDIVRDGWKYTHAASRDLLDSRPTVYDESEVHPLVGRVRTTVEQWDWIEQAAVRMRESGHILNVEVVAVPKEETGVLERVEAGIEQIRELDWKLNDVVVAVVAGLEDVPEDLLVFRTRRRGEAV